MEFRGFRNTGACGVHSVARADAAGNCGVGGLGFRV